MANRKKRRFQRSAESIIQIAVSTVGSYEEGDQTPVVFALTEIGSVYMMHTDEEDPVWARLPDIVEGEDEDDDG